MMNMRIVKLNQYLQICPCMRKPEGTVNCIIGFMSQRAQIDD